MKAREEIINILESSKDLKNIVKDINRGWHNEKAEYQQIKVTQISSLPLNYHGQ